MPLRTGSIAEPRAGVTLSGRAEAGPAGPPGPTGGTGADYAVVYNGLAHGVVADGVTDNTAAYTSIFGLANSGILWLPPGIYVGNLLCPDTGDTRSKNWHVRGSGVNSTFVVPNAANTPVLKKSNRASGIIEGATFGGFTLQAHAAGSTGPAIDLAGFRSCDFTDIGYISNGAFNYASMFHLSSGQLKCFRNRLIHVVIDGGTVQNTGPATVVLFDSKNDAGVAQGLSFTANDNSCENFFVFSNTGIVTGIDALRSDETKQVDCFWENNPGCTYWIPGTGALSIGNNYESGALPPVKYDSVVGEGASNNSISIKDHFSDMTALTLPATVQDNKILDPELALAVTWTDLGTNNIGLLGAKVLFGTMVTGHLGSNGAAPAVASTNLGVGGTVTVLAGSNDRAGVISLNFGTAVPAATGTITLTFAKAYAAVQSVIAVPAAGPPVPGTVWSVPAAAAQAFQVTALAVGQVQIFWANNAAPSDNAILRVNYHVVGLPN